LAYYPFDDHNVPTLEQMYDFCRDMFKWLEESPVHVSAVHCKAGKGRTGTMICAYLIYKYRDKFTPSQALDFYAARRTTNRKGVTIPSQIRFIEYFSEVIEDFMTESYNPNNPVILRSVQLFNPPNGIMPSFTLQVAKSPSTFFDFKEHYPLQRIKNIQSFTLSVPDLELNKEIKLEFYDEHTKIKLFFFWIHTKFITGDQFILKLEQLDKVQKKQHTFSPEFQIILNFAMNHKFVKATPTENSPPGILETNPEKLNTIPEIIPENPPSPNPPGTDPIEELKPEEKPPENPPIIPPIIPSPINLLTEEKTSENPPILPPTIPLPSPRNILEEKTSKKLNQTPVQEDEESNNTLISSGIHTEISIDVINTRDMITTGQGGEEERKTTIPITAQVVSGEEERKTTVTQPKTTNSQDRGISPTKKKPEPNRPSRKPLPRPKK